jgi:hypothetical protein
MQNLQCTQTLTDSSALSKKHYLYKSASTAEVGIVQFLTTSSFFDDVFEESNFFLLFLVKAEAESDRDKIKASSLRAECTLRVNRYSGSNA